MQGGQRRLAWFALMLAVSGLGAGPDVRVIDTAKAGNLPALRMLIRGGADVNTAQGDGTTALHWAAHNNNVQIADLLIRSGADVDAATDLRITPLWVASANNNSDVIGQLLQAGADPNIRPATGGTPLMRAARAGNVTGVRLMLARGAHPNDTEGSHQQTALMWAVAERHSAVTRVLVEGGADVNARAYQWKEIFQMCCPAGNSEGGSLAEVAQGGFTPLFFAAREGDAESARILLDAGANANEVAPDGTSVLALAAHSNHPDVVSVLLERGAEPNSAGGGYTALHAAVLRGNPETVRMLLAHKADPNPRLIKATGLNRNQKEYQFHKHWIGATPFWLAAAFHEKELMKTLAAGGADPQMTTPDGTTALIATASALPRLTEYENQTAAKPPSADEEREILEVVRFLVGEIGAQVTDANALGETAVHRAAGKRLNSVVQFLAERGAPVDSKNNKGQTPMMIVKGCAACEVGAFGLDELLEAAALGRDSMVALLRKLGAEQ